MQFPSIPRRQNQLIDQPTNFIGQVTEKRGLGLVICDLFLAERARNARFEFGEGRSQRSFAGTAEGFRRLWRDGIVDGIVDGVVGDLDSFCQTDAQEVGREDDEKPGHDPAWGRARRLVMVIFYFFGLLGWICWHWDVFIVLVWGQCKADWLPSSD